MKNVSIRDKIRIENHTWYSSNATPCDGQILAALEGGEEPPQYSCNNNYIENREILNWIGLGHIQFIGGYLLDIGMSERYLRKHEDTLREIEVMMKNAQTGENGGQKGYFFMAQAIKNAQEPIRVLGWLKDHLRRNSGVIHCCAIPNNWGLGKWQLWKSAIRLERTIYAVTGKRINIGAKTLRLYNKLTPQQQVLVCLDIDNYGVTGYRKWFRINRVVKPADVRVSREFNDYGRKLAAWFIYHGRIPKNREICRHASPSLSGKQLTYVAKQVKTGISGHDISGLSKMLIIFGLGQIDQLGKLLPYNAGNSLPDPDYLDQAQREFLIKYLKDGREYSDILKIIAANGRNKELFPLTRKFNDILADVNQDTNRTLDQELAYWYGDIEEMEDPIPHEFYTPVIETVPAVSITRGDWIIERLDKSDPVNLTAGKYTGCCQHIAGVGRTCAVHSVESPDGATYVVRRNGIIQAISWTWRIGNVLCFDNIEAKDGMMADHVKMIADLFTDVANSLVGRLGVKEVRVGTQYGIDVESYFSNRGVIENDTPEGIYTDAQNAIVIAKED